MKSPNPYFSKWMVLTMFFLYFPLTSSCSCGGGGSGQVCFTLDPAALSKCDLPQGTKLCMVSWLCYLDGGGLAHSDPVDTFCTTDLGQTYQVVTANVSAPRYGPDGGAVTFSYADLFYYEYHRYPTATELAAITASEAETWYTAEIQTFLHGYAIIVDESTTQETFASGGQVCHDKERTCDASTAPKSFSGFLEFPDGTICALKDVSYDDMDGTGFCNNTTVQVSLLPGCTECN